MTLNRSIRVTATGLLGLLVAAMTACSSPAVPGTPANGGASGTPSASAAATGTVPPAEAADLPDGIYRAELTADKVADLGGGPNDVGTLTLTIASGGYQLDCKPIADPGVDCGAHDPALGTTVELGYVKGVRPTVWFVHDQAGLSKKTGCVRRADSTQGCGPEGGYHVDWSLSGNQVTWSNYVGLGDEAGPTPTWWMVPWRRIG